MESNLRQTRWAELPLIQGWHVYHSDDERESACQAVTVRHTENNPLYRLGPKNKWGSLNLTAVQKEEYTRLNNRLHERILGASKSHFRGAGMPPEYDGNIEEFQRNDWKLRCPFTYQNRDWYGPSFECCVAVLENHISAKLILAYQNVLTDEFRDWCVVVGGCAGIDFGDEGEDFYVYSDEVIISAATAKALGVPQPL
jgi:hypothetical protein